MNLQIAENETIITNDTKLLCTSSYNEKNENNNDSSVMSLHEVSESRMSQEIITITDNDSSYNNSLTPENSATKEQCERNVLKGVNAFIEVYSGLENRSNCIANQMKKLGANVLSTFTKEATHLIFKHGRSKILTKARERNIKIVSVLWVERCKVELIRVPEEQFLVHECMPHTMEKKLRSMRPRDFNEQFSNSDKKIKNILASTAAAGQNPDSPIKNKSLKRTLFTRREKTANIIAPAKLVHNETFGKNDTSTVHSSPETLQANPIADNANIGHFGSKTHTTPNKQQLITAFLKGIDKETNNFNRLQPPHSEPKKRLHTSNVLEKIPVHNTSLLLPTPEKFPQSSSTSINNTNLKESFRLKNPSSLPHEPEYSQNSSNKAYSSLAESRSTLETILENATSEVVKDDCTREPSSYYSRSTSLWYKKEYRNLCRRRKRLINFGHEQYFANDSGTLRRFKKELKKLQAQCDYLLKDGALLLDPCEHSTSSSSQKKNYILNDIDTFNNNLKALLSDEDLLCDQNMSLKSKLEVICPVNTQSKEKRTRCDLSPRGAPESSNKRKRMNMTFASSTSNDYIDTLTKSMKSLSPSPKPSCSQSVNRTPEFNKKLEIESLTQSFKNLSPADKPLTPGCSQGTIRHGKRIEEIQSLTQRLKDYSSNKDTSVITEIKKVPTFKRRADIEAFDKLVENSKQLEEANISGISLILPDDLMDYGGAQKQPTSIASHGSGEDRLSSFKDSKHDTFNNLEKTDQLSFETPNQKLNTILKPRESVSEFKKYHQLQHSSKRPVRYGRHKSSITILQSQIRSKDNEILVEAVNKLGGAIVRSREYKQATHVVCGDDIVSFHAVKGIISGCWIVSFEWVKRSIQEKKWVDEEKFELVHTFPGAKISRQNKLNSQGFYSPDIFSSLGPIFISTPSSKLTTELQNIVLKCQGVVSGGYKNAKVSVGRYFKEMPSVNVPWILESIAQHKPAPFSDYSLSLSL